MAQRNTADSTQDGPALEPGSTPVADVKPVSAETQPTGVDHDQQVSYLQAIRDEYSQYVATSEIPWGNARAFNPGDPVPASHPGLEQFLADGVVEATGAAKKGKR